MTAREAQDLFLNKANVATCIGTSFGAWGEGLCALLVRQQCREHRARDRSNPQSLVSRLGFLGFT